MIRRIFRKKPYDPESRIGRILAKYNIPAEYFAINRRTVSRGVLVGLFWGFIPMPFQMLGVVATTALMRFNVPLAIALVWLSNPLTMPAMYYMEYLTGNLILGREGISHVQMTLKWFSDNWDRIVVPLYVGTAFYSIVVSFLAYLGVNILWMRSVRREKHRRERERRDRSKRS